MLIQPHQLNKRHPPDLMFAEAEKTMADIKKPREIDFIVDAIIDPNKIFILVDYAFFSLDSVSTPTLSTVTE